MFECQYTFVKTKAQEISIFPTYNLEVPSSSPDWSTLKNQAVTNFRNCFFLL